MSPSTPRQGAANPDITYTLLVDPGADWVLGSPGSSDFDKIDSLGPGGDYFFLTERENRYWLPILVGLRQITVRDFAAGAQFDGLSDSAALKQQWASCAVFSELDVDGPGAMDTNFYCAPTVTKGFFVLLSRVSELRKVVASVTLGLPLDRESLPPSIPIPPPPLK